ncbi:MAG: hypothetical protein HY717_20620 [Planctomycetes bacterium]|nr:hypothetical protein [Planctomycetota bacterium]
MKTLNLLIFSLAIAGCAGTPTPRDMAPYKAIVIFEWLGDEAGEPPQAPAEETSAASLNGAVPREWIEDELISGLKDHGVFSDFLVADWEDMHGVAVQEKADLIVLLRIGKLAHWKEDEVRIHPGYAVLDAMLWIGYPIGLGLGCWWVPDRTYPTQSDIEVFWKRPEPEKAAGRKLARPKGIADIQTEFRLKESLSSGEYRLSLWERAKLWRYPVAYLLNILMPAALIPLSDEREVAQSLAAAALEDIQRELSQKLGAQNLDAAGAPFLFRLEEPANGSAVDGPAARLRYRYRLESGFKEHEATLLSELRIEIRREGDGDYLPRRRYRGEGIRAVNDRIARDAILEEEIEGLGSGLNLVRFVARTELGGKEITNTIALLGP